MLKVERLIFWTQYSTIATTIRTVGVFCLPKIYSNRSALILVVSITGHYGINSAILGIVGLDNLKGKVHHGGTFCFRNLSGGELIQAGLLCIRGHSLHMQMRIEQLNGFRYKLKREPMVLAVKNEAVHFIHVFRLFCFIVHRRCLHTLCNPWSLAVHFSFLFVSIKHHSE